MNSVTGSIKLKILPHVPTWYRLSNEGAEEGKRLALKRAHEIASEHGLMDGEYLIVEFDHIDMGGCRIYEVRPLPFSELF